METCKTCLYWGRNLKNRVADCDLIDGYQINNEPYINVNVHDDSGLDVVLKTPENFGCTLHVNKTK